MSKSFGDLSIRVIIGTRYFAVEERVTRNRLGTMKEAEEALLRIRLSLWSGVLLRVAN